MKLPKNLFKMAQEHITFTNRKTNNPDDFWREYEEKTGDTVLAKGLGRYISGWEEFDSKKWNSIWGLIIASSGGFRFHHFPHRTWVDALSFNSSREEPKEKTIFLPKEKIISAKLIKETRWWKKILSPSPPQLIINYRDETEKERRILLEAEFKADDIAEKLNNP